MRGRFPPLLTPLDQRLGTNPLTIHTIITHYSTGTEVFKLTMVHANHLGGKTKYKKLATGKKYKCVLTVGWLIIHSALLRAAISVADKLADCRVLLV